MGDHLLYPKLRWPVDLRLEKLEGQEVLIVNCPLGISSEPLVLVAAVAPIVASFDGNQRIEEVVQKFARYGVQRKLIEELVSLLDSRLFLAGPGFDAAKELSNRQFRDSGLRGAALAGRVYPQQKEDLETEISGYLQGGNKIGSRMDSSGRSMLTLVAPHIDYRRGGISYGAAYSALKDEQADLYVLAGTSHQYSKTLFQLTLKDFDSPLGPFPCDKEFVKELASCYGERRSFEDEFLHKNEHSLELQLPFLGLIHNCPRIVPILVGSFHKILQSNRYPEEVEEYRAFAEGLASALKNAVARGKRVCFIAGVDMAHVGRAFGDKGQLSEGYMREIRQRDEAYLRAIENQDKRALFDHIAEDNDARRVCGFPTMYLLIDVLDSLGVSYSAEVFDYRQAVDYNNDCAVTFAGMGLYV